MKIEAEIIQNVTHYLSSSKNLHTKIKVYVLTLPWRMSKGLQILAGKPDSKSKLLNNQTNTQTNLHIIEASHSQSIMHLQSKIDIRQP